MKTLRISLIAIVLLSSLTSCVKEELDDDVLVNQDEVEVNYFTGGGIDEK